VYSGYVTLKSPTQSLVLPYLGVVGNLRSVTVLTTSNTFLADFNLPVAANTTYTIPRPLANATASTSAPYLRIQPTIGTRVLRVEIMAEDTGVMIGSVPGYPKQWMPRGTGSSDTVYFSGLLSNGTVVPEGTYRVVVSALRVFGDDTRQEDWDTVNTVPFIIKYIA
jgi:hypothetical protein